MIKCDAIVRVFSHFPDDRVKPVFSTVEIIMILIILHLFTVVVFMVLRLYNIL